MNTTTPAVRGTVYGVILNDRDSLARLGSALEDAPYQAAPKSVPLYLKPANTVVASGATVYLPAGETAVEVGATLGVVFSAPAARLAPEQREPLLLVCLEQFSYAEAAEVMHIPVGTVMSRVCRARATLRGLLDAPAKLRRVV